jgi:hybrid cluster-associated redox disulfide protein
MIRLMQEKRGPMRESLPGPDWKIAEIIERCSGAPVVFSRFGMACVGCAMAPFETLTDAALAYGLNPGKLLREFRRACRGKAAKE